MAERNLDFDNIIDRYGTKSLKYDFKKERGIPEDALSLWVADMDFRISSYIEDALIRQVQHGIYGYTEIDDEYFEVSAKWVRNHFGWDVKKEWLHKSPGVVFAIATAVRAYTEPGDAVIINQPVYYPFSEVIKDNGRKLVSSNLVRDESGRYGIDFADFEKKIIEENVKLYILCSPHNPVGRVWNQEELKLLGEICKKHKVTVFSDEIHADFIWGKEFTTFAKAGEDFGEFAITALSPSKTFNIAGLQVANLFIPNKSLHRKFRHEYNASGYSQLNAAGIIAGQAAYENGEEWLDAAKKYIESNIDFAVGYVKARMPGVKLDKPEGTYLIWLDFKGLGIEDRELDRLIIHEAKLWLDGGSIFGPVGAGFQRINAACPRSILKEALERIETALRNKGYIE